MPAESVQVCIRCRPFSSTEKKDKRVSCVDFDRNSGCITVTNIAGDGKQKQFTYDRIFPMGTAQKQLYEESAATIVDGVLQGYNGTIFAYGQTGTGKTYTMEGPDIIESDDDKGVNPRAFRHIFDTIDASEDVNYLVRISFIQIYQDEVMDLLGKKDVKLKVKRNDTGFFVQDLNTFVVQSADDIDKLMQEGKKNRKTGSTAMNERSSRSHCMFTVIVESSAVGADGQEHIRVGKLNLVDLAGSEKQSKTAAEGQRLKEAAKINLSLSALGNVIAALVSKKIKHVPYYDSKLTRLLMDSLGGNTKTAMIANIGPAEYNFDETVSTLRFASRAKNIQNKPKINEDPKDAMMREFQDEIEKLRAQLAMAEAMGETGEVPEEIQKKLGMRLAPKKVVIEKVVERVVKQGVSKEELAKLEEEAEEKRRKLEERAAKEKEEIASLTQSHQARAESLMEQAKTKEEVAAEKKRVKDELAEKLAAVEAKIVHGNKLMDQSEKTKILLAQKRTKLAEDERRKKELERHVKAKEEEQLNLNQKFESQEKEIQVKTKQLDKLRRLYKEIKAEIADVSDENEKEREDLLQTIRDLTKHVRLKEHVINHFVPPYIQDQIHARAVFDENKDEWYLRPYSTENVKIEGNPKSARPGFTRATTDFSRIRRALGDRNPRFALDNTIQLELDMPDRTTRDYEELLHELEVEDRGPSRDRQMPHEGYYDDEYGADPYLNSSHGLGRSMPYEQGFEEDSYEDERHHMDMRGGRY